MLLNKQISSIYYRNGIELINHDLSNFTVLSGSFNPLHNGHLELLKKAHATSGKEKMVFELSVDNKDKGEVDEE